jgi:ectoine hydroxylase-related dioxygenase (phytanoyl-CoA dioxygenase family)
MPTKAARGYASFLFSELMAEVVRATLGETACLFNEQYVVKSAEKGLKFGWHQDSGFVAYPHWPYLSCWCALDDVTVENGTVYLLPYSRAGNLGTFFGGDDSEARAINNLGQIVGFGIKKKGKIHAALWSR